jgi:hypothetical protein
MTQNLDQTTRAVLAADVAHLNEAIESVEWERRGLLQRLVVRAASTNETAPEGRQPGK